ncbi:MAG: integrin alpha, partial [Candidatus Hodarchaeales archaeon]
MERKTIRKYSIDPKMIVITCLIACLFILGRIISYHQPLTSNNDSSGAMTCIKDETTKFPQLSASQWHMGTNLGKANASFIGEKSEDLSGWAVAGVGDVNNDGYDDIIIGAESNNENGENAGKTYLIFGRSTALWWMDINLSEADVSFIGEDSHDHSGFAVAGAGDVNNDGFDDIVIGASGDEKGGNEAGQTYLILGRPTNQWQMNIDLAEANASFIGEDYDDRSGWSVAGVGDVNNDNFDDIVIGASGNKEGGSGAGKTYLILGRPTNQWRMEIDLAEANASFIGEESFDFSGIAVAGAGDVNNDSYYDILIGASANDEGGFGAGQTYLILGRPTNQWQRDINLTEADASFIGEDFGDSSGIAVAGAGDVNNDSFDDILIGASSDEEGGIGAGQTYLILGGLTNQWRMDIDLAEANASFIGEDNLYNSGNAVAGVGDTNKDGFDDIVIGASGSWEAGSGSGQAYLILGRPTNHWRVDTDLSESNASFVGEDNYDAAGWAVAGAGDVNNDGFADILISASGDEEGGEDAGQTYLILPYIPPKIDITSPINTTYRQRNTTLTYTVSNGAVTFYIDGKRNTTILPSGSILSNLPEGIHNITLVVVDQGENVYINTIIFTLDNTPPIITIISPTPGIYTTNMITLSFFGDAKHYWYYIEDLDARNQSWTVIYDRTLSDGIYTLHVYGNDSIGNEGYAVVTFSIDTTPPNLGIDSPLLMIYTISTIDIDFSGNADHFWYYIEGIDNTNQSWNEVENRTLPDGTYILHVYGNDSIGNEV